jgi:hypothetical protein
MKASALFARFVSVAILLFAFSMGVYLARTQPIAHDEATTYTYFLDSGVYHVLFYDPANHVLFTILAKPERFPRVYWKPAGLAIAAIVLFDYAISMQTSYFRYNAYDVISRDLFQAIAKDAGPRGLTNVRVGGTWWYETEINFYRRRYKAAWLLPYDIKDRSYFWETPNSLFPRTTIISSIFPRAIRD